jgi:hypothetical protein
VVVQAQVLVQVSHLVAAVLVITVLQQVAVVQGLHILVETVEVLVESQDPRAPDITVVEVCGAGVVPVAVREGLRQTEIVRINKEFQVPVS